ncbi:MAG TPA: C4-type zinc ribbon domain-containing protein [Bryobacteraceae bacterium]|nr:C4-type zinc ribbon domain-containing protein [Bryobacteraceae bacterium]
MAPEIELVTRLQTLDTQITELQRAIAALPRHIAEIEKALDSHNRRLEADRAALAANQKERRSLEDDNKTQEQKISKLRDQMLGARTNEQYRAFQSEIDFCARAIRKAEDRILDLMGESEPLDANVKAAEAALKAEKASVEAEKAEARLKSEADKKRMAELQAERAAMAAKLNPKVLRLYDHQRRKWGSNTVVEVVEGRCTGCQINLRPQFLQDLRRGDQLMACETCGRILFYNPPVNLEHEMAAGTGGALNSGGSTPAA